MRIAVNKKSKTGNKNIGKRDKDSKKKQYSDSTKSSKDNDTFFLNYKSNKKVVKAKTVSKDSTKEKLSDADSNIRSAVTKSSKAVNKNIDNRKKAVKKNLLQKEQPYRKFWI